VGDRYALDVVISRMSHADAAIWASVLTRAIREDARMPWPQPGIVIGSPGAALIDGAGQTGSTIALRAMTPGYTVQQGQFFSILQAGVRSLHHAIAPTVVNGAGKAVLAIWPMLRIVTLDGSPCNFTAPEIEGELVGAEQGIRLIRARADALSFSIVERE
jgi:hypothetical protein